MSLTFYLDRWKYVKEHNVQLPDEYDQIYVDLQPFWGIKPADLRKIQAEWEGHVDTYTLGKMEDGPLRIIADELPEDPIKRKNLLVGAHEMIRLLEDIQHLLPSFRAVFSPHDSASIFINHGAKSKALKAAASGKGEADIVRYILYAHFLAFALLSIGNKGTSPLPQTGLGHCLSPGLTSAHQGTIYSQGCQILYL